MVRRTFRGLWARKRRVVGTATAIVLGVGFLAATLVLGDTLDRGFGDLFAQANRGTAVVVRDESSVNTDSGRQRPPIPTDVAARVAAVPGVANVVAEVTGPAQLLGADGDPIGGNGPPTDAGTWIDDPALNPYRMVEGRAPARTGEAVVDAASARTGDLSVGDTVTLLTPDPVQLRLVGVAGFGDGDSMAGATFVGLTPDQATALLGQAGEASDLRVRGDGSRSDAELAAAIAEVVPKGTEAITGAELTDQQLDDVQGDFLGFVKAFLVAFAGIALVVATFSIANTFTILSAQRSRESALLRAIGAGRGQVLVGSVFEALVIGVLASAVGLAVGLGLAKGLDALLGAFGLDLPADALVIEPQAMIRAFVVGVVVTLVAAILPAVRSARVAPIEALRESAAESVSVSRIRAAAGALIGAAGAIVMITATRSADGALGRAGLGALLVVVGVIALGPALARPAALVVGAPIARGRGLIGGLARRNAVRNPRRTASSSLALVIGAAVVALFATFGSSIRLSIDQTVDRSFGGDLVVMSESFSGPGLSPALAPAIAERPEVEDAVALSNASILVRGEPEYPTAADPAALARLVDLDVSKGSIARMQPGQVAVSEDYAEHHHLRIGSAYPVDYADGTGATYRVGAVYGQRDLMGDVVMTATDWKPHALRTGDVAVLVGLSKGTSLDQGRAAVESVAGRFGSPTVEDRDQYIDRVAGQVDQLLTLVYGMLVLAIVIALIGLANTLSLSIHERTRELGLLRAVGLTRGGLRAMVRWESVITAVVGTVVGLGLGTFLAWGLVRALSAQEGFVSFQAPGATVVVVLVLSVAAGVVAALRPAHRASRLDVLTAIATD